MRVLPFAQKAVVRFHRGAEGLVVGAASSSNREQRVELGFDHHHSFKNCEKRNTRN
jgi:hypothetical protein